MPSSSPVCSATCTSSHGSVTGTTPKRREEAAGGREGEDAQALQIGERVDRLLGGEVARIPGAGRDVLDADLGVFLPPDFVQALVVEERRNVERVARAPAGNSRRTP